MPKKSRKSKESKSRLQAQGASKNLVASDVEDNESVLSVPGDSGSDCTSITAVESPNEDEVESSTLNMDVDVLENNLKDCIDAVSEKSFVTRVAALKKLIEYMQLKYLRTVLFDQKLTLSSALEKCLKKGKAEERCLASITLGLLFIHLCDDLEADVEVQSIYRDLKPYLVTLIQDPSVASQVRGFASLTLSLMCFLVVTENSEEIDSVMNVMQSVFRGSFLKGDKSVPQLSEDVSEMHTSAMRGWSLLFSLSFAYADRDHLHLYHKQARELLTSPSLNIKIAAGDILGLLVEKSYKIPDVKKLCEELQQLSTDGRKNVSKDKLRSQRSHFRDVVAAVQDGNEPASTIKLNRFSGLELTSRGSKVQYETIRRFLKHGMLNHLQNNPLLVAIFGDCFYEHPSAPMNGKTLTPEAKSMIKQQNVEASRSQKIDRRNRRDQKSSHMTAHLDL